MKKIVSTLLLCWWFMLPIVAFSQNGMYKNCGTGNEESACLSDPKGIIKDSEKIKESIETMNWILTSIGIVLAIFCGFKVSSKLNDEDWKGAAGPAVGGILAILTMVIVYQYIK